MRTTEEKLSEALRLLALSDGVIDACSEVIADDRGDDIAAYYCSGPTFWQQFWEWE